MYVYIYIYIYTCIFVYMCIHNTAKCYTSQILHAYIYIYRYIRINMCIHTFMIKYICIHEYTQPEHSAQSSVIPQKNPVYPQKNPMYPQKNLEYPCVCVPKSPAKEACIFGKQPCISVYKRLLYIYVEMAPVYTVYLYVHKSLKYNQKNGPKSSAKECIRKKALYCGSTVLYIRQKALYIHKSIL